MQGPQGVHVHRRLQHEVSMGPCWVDGLALEQPLQQKVTGVPVDEKVGYTQPLSAEPAPGADKGW